MSHVAQISMEIKDLDALAAACKDLGLELVRNQHTYKWYGYSVGDYPLPEGFTAEDLGKCDHAIRVPGNPSAYEIGVVRNRTGNGYVLLWDFWQGGYGMQARVGDHGEKLKQGYTVHVASRYWQKKGFHTTTTQRTDGQVVVRAYK